MTNMSRRQAGALSLKNLILAGSVFIAAGTLLVIVLVGNHTLSTWRSGQEVIRWNHTSSIPVPVDFRYAMFVDFSQENCDVHLPDRLIANTHGEMHDDLSTVTVFDSKNNKHDIDKRCLQYKVNPTKLEQQLKMFNSTLILWKNQTDMTQAKINCQSVNGSDQIISLTISYTTGDVDTFVYEVKNDTPTPLKWTTTVFRRSL